VDTKKLQPLRIDWVGIKLLMQLLKVRQAINPSLISLPFGSTPADIPTGSKLRQSARAFKLPNNLVVRL
jgi:hypothetical protein